MEAKANVCHHVTLMHASTSSHFPHLAQTTGRLGKTSRRKEWRAFIFKGIWVLFMPVPHIIVLICLNQSVPGGVKNTFTQIGCKRKKNIF